MDDINVTPVLAGSSTVENIPVRPQRPAKTAADWVRDMRMSPEVNKTTVGVETDRITPDLLMATSSKLLGISRREQDPDQKDSLLFQRFYGPAEYFAEHVLRDGGKVARNLLWKATNKGKIDFVPSGALDQHISDVFYTSKLAQMIDGSSPLETVDAAFKTTRVGEGGVADVQSAPDEMRTVQASYFGYLDPVRSAERKRVGLDMYMTKNVVKGSDGKLYQRFINARTGKEELVDSVTASKSVVAAPEMMDADTKSVFALGGRTGVRIVPKDQVDYYLPRADDAYSTASNLVAMPNGVKEMRLLMGCLHPGTPLVTISSKNEITITPAKSIGKNAYGVPGCDGTGKSTGYLIRNSIAKFPQKRKWFKKVVLLSGRSLITSYDHRWPVLRDNALVLVNADKLQPGDQVLRSTFKDLPNRRTFMRGVLVNKDVATLLGCIVRSVTQPEPGKLRVVYQPSQKTFIDAAIKRLKLEGSRFYANAGDKCLAIHDASFIQWVEKEICIEPEERRVPTVILSACLDIASHFIDAYTANPTQVGIDSNEDMWILDIPSMICRDGLALLLARMQTDTLYRDAVRSDGVNLALKLVEQAPTFGDSIVDEVKVILEVEKVPIMIDIDIDDNMYAAANGIITHNSKYPLQAISLLEREAPLVRNLDEATGKDMPTLVGKYLGARFAKQGGTVTAVRKDRIDVIYDDGTKGQVSLYQNFPMNAKGYITNTPVVKAGQSFKKGDILASSNYTDDKGVAAIGKNLRSGWLSWKGGTYEDAVVLSESAAKALTSRTMYKSAVDLDKTVSLGKKNYVSWKPSEYTKDQLEALDDNGIVKPGAVLRRGDPMILAVQTTEPSPGTLGKRVLTDISETWEHDHPGVVTDVVKTRKGVKVYATVEAPAEIGDKISGHYGNKGVVSQLGKETPESEAVNDDEKEYSIQRIVPDAMMPLGEDGKPLDLLFSPLGLVSRTNASMIHEALLGKIARKTGKPYVIPAFYKGDLYDLVESQLKQHHINDTEDLTDPYTGKKIPKVLTGVSYIYKLKHQAESKLSARGTDSYTAEGQPGGGGFTGSKRYGTLETSALVGHQAFDTLLDAAMIRGQSNADFWRSIRTGEIPTIPGEPLVHRKFFVHLTGSGVNVRKTPKGISVFSLSNDDVKELAGPRELKSKDTYEARTFRPIDGGLFGQDLFGPNGDRWAYIQLDEPLPNPVMEEPLARLLRMSTKDFMAVAAGKAEVNGMKSSADIKERLSKINLEAEEKQAQREFKDAPMSKKDAALKRYRDIARMKANEVPPDQYMLDRIPVLPPIYRPVSTHNGLTMVADSNYLYAQMMDARDDMREAKNLPEEYQQQARENLYRSWKELTGMYEPENVKLKNKHVQGLLKWALGSSPKWSAVQRKIIGSTVDTVGRGVIAPDPRLKLNQLGVPVPMALGIFEPFVARAMVKQGYTPVEALKMIKARDKRVMPVLVDVMKHSPVQLNRAPSLHKLNIMGFEPVLVAGHAVKVNPSIVVPFAADFDGDSILNMVEIVIDLNILAKKIECIGISGLTSLEKAVSCLVEHQKKESTMIAKDQRALYATACAPLCELPTVPGSEVRKSDTVTEWDVQEGFYTYTKDPVTGDTVLAPITKVSRHQGLTMLDCTISQCGAFTKVVTASDDHSLITLNPTTLELEKTRPADAVGRCVPRVRYNAGNDPNICARYMDMGRRVELTYDFGVFIGMMLGDGWVDAVGVVRLACCDRSLQQYILEKYTMEDAPIPMRKKAELFVYPPVEDRFSDKDRARFTLYLPPEMRDSLKSMIGTGAKNKRVPEDCFMASRAHITGILMGLLATDGAVTYSTGNKSRKAATKTIAVHTISPLLRDGIQELAARIGIRTSATPYKGVNSVETCYAVTLSLEDVAREARKHPALFRIPMARKQEALDKIVADVLADEGSGTSSNIHVPFPRGLFGEFSYAKVATMCPAVVKARATGHIQRKYALTLADMMEKVDWSQYSVPSYLAKKDRVYRTPKEAEALVRKWIAMVRDEETDWCIVTAVTPSSCTEGWDCTVPGPYTFALFDGTVVQDTANVHAPVSDNARRETYEKMFPERNLISMRNRQILYKPEKEYMQGLYVATRMKKGTGQRPRIFSSVEEARQALRKGIIDIDDPIEIRKQ